MDEQITSTYATLSPEQVAPLVETELTLASMDRATTAIMRAQHALARLPLLKSLNLIALLQAFTPASVQRKLAVKKAVQAAQYLGQHNRACIAFWREHGLQTLDFLDPQDADSLRHLPVMEAEFFYTYSPEDRFSRSLDDVTALASSGSTGKPKHFLTCPADALRTLPAMTQFIRSNWKIDAFERVEIVVHTIRAEPDAPQWGAGYNMTRLLSLVAEDYPYIHFVHLTEVEAAVAHIREVLANVAGKTLIAVYSYPPDTSAIIRELTDSGRDFDCPPGVSFKFMLTGEALPPYRLFQMATWLHIIEADFASRRVEELVQDAAGRRQLRALVDTFSTGFGAAEIQTGFSGDDTTALWNLVLALLQRNEPERVAPFLERCFDGQSFPWSALKTGPNIFLLLGSQDAQGRSTLDPPAKGGHAGIVFATALSGAVVNCKLDYMHIWDMAELAAALRAETGVNIRQLARRLGIRYGAGEMILTNGRMDQTGAGGLEAAISWSGQSIYGHNFHTVASRIAELTGRFTAQGVDYRGGERVFWVHFEAQRAVDLAALQRRVALEAVEILESVNREFAHQRSRLLQAGGEAAFRRTFRIQVLPYGHARFQREPGQQKYRYILKPQYRDEDVESPNDPAL
ncbi:MAG: hypothetical protein U9Q70_08035 [Chloroflexota bacterium]|nr:hypothetical protein [Chloroflexota bacterium]